MLIVMHHGAVERLDGAAFDLETTWRGDVLEVDRAEGGTQFDQDVDDLVDRQWCQR